MNVRWFSTAGNPFKKRPVRTKPKAPRAPSTQYKSPDHRQRSPKLRKPRVESPFSEAPKQISNLVTADESHIDVSGDMIRDLQDKISERGWRVKRIKWVLGDNHSDHDFGWCAKLASKSWNDFNSFFAERFSKPKEILKKDQRRGFTENCIMGVSHAGCLCKIWVTVSDPVGNTAWKYEIGTEPSSYDADLKPIDGEEPGAADEFESVDPTPDLEQEEDEGEDEPNAK